MSTPSRGQDLYGNPAAPSGPYVPPSAGHGPAGYGPSGYGAPAGDHPAYGSSPYAPGGYGGAPQAGAAPGPQDAAQAPSGAGWVPSGVTPQPPKGPRPGLGERQFTAAPQRSRTALALQYVLQYLYIPVWALLAFALLAVVIAIDILGDGNVGLPGAMFAFKTTAISWRRLRVEWTGRTDLWAPFTDDRFAALFPKAEKNSGWEAAKLPPSGVRRAECALPVRHYRGLDSAAVEQLAGRRGWSVDWQKTRDPRSELHLYRLIAPPQHTSVPDPYGPAPRRGEPWGPLPRRFATPLLTLVFMPRLRALELRDSADAYLAHLRTRLPRFFAAETKRDPRRGYLAEEGRILRRVSVPSWHFRGAGAHAVLAVAAEHGWHLDHSFPAEPDGPVRLCRPDLATPPA
ncbi:hypothetical protein [Streptomyces sp. NRRL F-5123]|uniref:hypothetical protein n=1 Tax=Streptomyces sp. NRRL F-5123 TaxID=1463856 RepID=UPI0004E19076|nr:hypothetical protein [Streptomyces sp. NRRL F-5123]